MPICRHADSPLVCNHRSGSADTVFQSVFRQFGSAVEAESSHHVRLVKCDRLSVNIEDRRDLLDGMSFRQQLHRLPLAMCQFAGRVPYPRGQPGNSSEISLANRGVTSCAGEGLRGRLFNNANRGALLQNIAGRPGAKGPGDIK